MNIIISILADIVHIIKILVICKWYLMLDENRNKGLRYFFSIILTAVFSIIIMYCDNVIVDFSLYVVCVVDIITICYTANIAKTIICSSWTIMIVELIDLMILNLLETTNEIWGGFSQTDILFLAGLISLIFVIIAGFLLQKIDRNGIKHIDIRYLVMITGIIVVDAIIMCVLDKATIAQVSMKNRVLYTVSFVLITIGMYIQIAAVLLLVVSRNNYRKKELIVKQCLYEQISHYEYLKR